MPQLQERENVFVEKRHLVNQDFSNPGESAGDRVNMADPDSIGLGWRFCISDLAN